MDLLTKHDNSKKLDQAKTNDSGSQTKTNPKDPVQMGIDKANEQFERADKVYQELFMKTEDDVLKEIKAEKALQI